MGYRPLPIETAPGKPSADNVLPRVPNLPFFYLCYRAWSHWRAMAGGKHLQFLLRNNLLIPTPSPIVDAVYAEQKEPLPSTPEPTTTGPGVEGLPTLPGPPNMTIPHPEGETMLLSQAKGKKMTQALDLPQLEVELERAIWQVQTAIEKSNAEASTEGEGDTNPPKEAPKSDATKSQDGTGPP